MGALEVQAEKDRRFQENILLLKDFIYSHYRLPITTKEEKYLYNFYRDCYNFYKENTLSDFRKNLFLSIFPDGVFCEINDLSDKLYLMQEEYDDTGYLTILGAVKGDMMSVQDAIKWQKRGFVYIKDILQTSYFKVSSSQSPEDIYDMLNKIIGLPDISMVRLYIDIESAENNERFVAGGRLSLKKFFYDVFQKRDGLRLLNLIYFEVYCYELVSSVLDDEHMEILLDFYGFRNTGYYDGMAGREDLIHQKMKRVLQMLAREKTKYNIIYAKNKLFIPEMLRKFLKSKNEA